MNSLQNNLQIRNSQVVVSTPPLGSSYLVQNQCGFLTSALIAFSADENVFCPCCCPRERTGKPPANKMPTAAISRRLVQSSLSKLSFVRRMWLLSISKFHEVLGHPRRKCSVNGDVAALAGLVLGKQEAQQKHHRGNRSEQPVDLDVGEGLSLSYYEAVHSGKCLL